MRKLPVLVMFLLSGCAHCDHPPPKPDAGPPLPIDPKGLTISVEAPTLEITGESCREKAEDLKNNLGISLKHAAEKALSEAGFTVVTDGASALSARVSVVVRECNIPVHIASSDVSTAILEGGRLISRETEPSDVWGALDSTFQTEVQALLASKTMREWSKTKGKDPK